MPKQKTSLALSQPEIAAGDVANFINAAPATTPRPSSAATPDRGHVVQASGRVVRRLVVNLDPEIGAELERRREASGASLSRIANDLFRSALGL